MRKAIFDLRFLKRKHNVVYKLKFNVFKTKK